MLVYQRVCIPMFFILVVPCHGAAAAWSSGCSSDLHRDRSIEGCPRPCWWYPGHGPCHLNGMIYWQMYINRMIWWWNMFGHLGLVFDFFEVKHGETLAVFWASNRIENMRKKLPLLTLSKSAKETHQGQSTISELAREICRKRLAIAWLL